jgi:hypothetical protein
MLPGAEGSALVSEGEGGGGVAGALAQPLPAVSSPSKNIKVTMARFLSFIEISLLSGLVTIWRL